VEPIEERRLPPFELIPLPPSELADHYHRYMTEFCRLNCPSARHLTCLPFRYKEFVNALGMYLYGEMWREMLAEKDWSEILYRHQPAQPY
jgi:hypothetical protein